MEETQNQGQISPKPKKGLTWPVVLIVILVLIVVYFALAQKGVQPTSPATGGEVTIPPAPVAPQEPVPPVPGAPFEPVPPAPNVDF